jgi:predicted RNase H-like nuclease (RuvC/YqgF family)
LEGELTLDITGIDIAALGAALGSIGGTIAAIIKAVKSGNEAAAAKAETVTIQEERKAQAEFRDRQVQDLNTRFAVLENRVSAADKRLDEGAANFKQLDSKIDELRNSVDNKIDCLSASVNQLIGEIRSGR